MKSRICEMLGIKYPIFQGAMAWIADASLASAVSNAGGLGIIAAGNQAYQDLDAQPVQGENIISSKKEIEKTLDTLNRAFEKLLDDLFQETAWDVSTDISVLHTMLAQEGLTEDGLKK